MRSQRVVVLFAVAALVAAFVAWPRGDFILYNPSTSVPRGFYVRASSEPLVVGTLVTVRARDVAQAYAQQRGFVDAGVRFLKRIAAVEGDLVCAVGDEVTINDELVVQRQREDTSARALPRWEECRALRAGEVFLLGDTKDSFDGRYWGPVPVAMIEGVWRPLGS